MLWLVLFVGFSVLLLFLIAFAFLIVFLFGIPILLILLYLAIIARGLKIAEHAPTLFARLMAGTISLNFFTYVFVNMGMVSGVLPVVGVPLPFLSYGGTALLTLFIAIGLLMSVQKHRRLIRS